MEELMPTIPPVKLRRKEKKVEVNGEKIVSAAFLRLQRDLEDLELPPQCQIKNQQDLFSFDFYVSPDEGMWKDCKYHFTVVVPLSYPFDPPRVRCLTKILHPNLDISVGAVCLNILRLDWNPVLDLSSVLYGLYNLFLEPSLTEPLDKEAAELLGSDPNEFRALVLRQLGATAMCVDTLT